jgi:hypothetical protein
MHCTFLTGRGAVGGQAITWRRGLHAATKDSSRTFTHHPRAAAEWGIVRSAEVKFCKQPFTTPKKKTCF